MRRRYEDARDDYRAIIVKALADRLAGACAEHVHLQAGRAWFEPGTVLAPGTAQSLAVPAVEQAPRAVVTVGDLHAERFRGIRPAFGYPDCPDHSEKAKLAGLLDAGRLGIALTESFAMTPAGRVPGLAGRDHLDAADQLAGERATASA